MIWFALPSQSQKLELSRKTTWIQVEAVPPAFYEKKQAKEKQQPKQVVQTSPGKKVDIPDPDAFLGWQNQIVDRQTVGKKQVMGQSKENSPPKKAQRQAHHKLDKNILPKLGQNKKTQRSDILSDHSLSSLGVPLFREAKQQDLEQNSDHSDFSLGSNRPEDYVKGITPGSNTALNTKEFIFYGYFQRIRERLDRAWIPILRDKLLAYHRNGRHLASEMDLTTRVIVILNERGEITRVQLIKESGANDLDESAVAAFNRAGPFPNPPKGMVDTNKEVKIPWDFILKT